MRLTGLGLHKHSRLVGVGRWCAGSPTVVQRLLALRMGRESD